MRERRHPGGQIDLSVVENPGLYELDPDATLESPHLELEFDRQIANPVRLPPGCVDMLGWSGGSSVRSVLYE